jgi:hypothetical protein
MYKRQVTSSSEPNITFARDGDRNSLRNVEQVLDSDDCNVKKKSHKFVRMMMCAAVRPSGYLTSYFEGTGEDFYEVKCKGMEDLLIYLFIY